MGDTSGQAGTVTVMTPVRGDAVKRLGGVLDELQLPQNRKFLDARAIPDNSDSGRTHFARFVVLTDLPDEPPHYASRPLADPFLFFTASFDGPLATYYSALLLSMNRGRPRSWADRIWGCCQGFPGSASTAAFAAYLGSHRVPTTKFVAAYGDSTVQQVRRALATQEKLRLFAIAQEGAPAEALHREFRAMFIPANGSGS